MTQLVLRLTANEPSGNYGSVLGLIADELCGDSACPWTRCVVTRLVLGLDAWRLGLSLDSLRKSRVVTGLVLRLIANEPCGDSGLVHRLTANELF